MALIKCPECGNNCSDKASDCIHCGHPLCNSIFESDLKPENKNNSTSTTIPEELSVYIDKVDKKNETNNEYIIKIKELESKLVPVNPFSSVVISVLILQAIFIFLSFFYGIKGTQYYDIAGVFTAMSIGIGFPTMIVSIACIFFADKTPKNKGKKIGILSLIIESPIPVFMFFSMIYDIIKKDFSIESRVVTIRTAEILIVVLLLIFFLVKSQKKVSSNKLIQSEINKLKKGLNMSSMEKIVLKKYNIYIPILFVAIILQAVLIIIDSTQESNEGYLLIVALMVSVIIFILSIICIIHSEKCYKRRGRIIGIIFASCSGIILLITIILLAVLTIQLIKEIC